MLQDGRLWLLGGEYTGNPFVAHFSNTAEIYDPLTNSWSPAAPIPRRASATIPACCLTAEESSLDRSAAQQLVYNIATNTWGPAIPKVYNDRSDEEGWVKLADGSVLTYDLFQSKATRGSYAEKFDPTTNTWISVSPSDGTANGFIPQLSANSVGSELGPMLRLQDGRVFIVGATGHTALYDESTNTWSAGPDVMGTLNGTPTLFGADDAPGCVMPNGHVLFAADAGPSLKTFAGPTQLFDFDPDTNTISSVPSPTTDFDDPQFPAYVLRFLVLANRPDCHDHVERPARLYLHRAGRHSQPDPSAHRGDQLQRRRHLHAVRPAVERTRRGSRPTATMRKWIKTIRS